MRLRHLAWAIAPLALMAGCKGTGGPQSVAGTGVTEARIIAAEPAQWLSTGRTYDEQRYSPLDQLNQSNVGKLGLAWFADLDTARGQEATPLMVDGKLIVSTAWSMVKAFDARTGKPLWSFDPQVPRETLVKACCDAVNRGVAAWGGKVFVGTLDGRLIALDMATGKPAWSQVTVDQTKPYTITGAPRIIKGKVIIGNGGAEYGVRGYITAYDAETGKQLWRFYTVPGDPRASGDAPYLQKAAETWKGEWWKMGGGGTVWDSMAYDPELDLLYIGVGNGSPWNQAIRSPGGGDNLYLSSIVALKPETGDYVWHYQTTPGETWDFTATQHIILADMKIEGKDRKVLMQAPKNGFFYVIDRTDGKLISARNFIPISWASGIDMKTGRPIEKPEARFDKTGKPSFQSPGAGGAHSWHPMSYSPKTGLVYLPAQIAAFPYFPVGKDWKPSSIGFNTGTDFAAPVMPADPAVRQAALKATAGELIAWDPIRQAPRWTVKYPGPNNGGLLSTAGDLVFQGTAGGKFVAYGADSGKTLWSFDAQTGIIAAPMTYSIDGEQYVAVLAGWGGIWAVAPGILSGASGNIRNVSRLLVFKLDGKTGLPALAPQTDVPLDPPAQSGTAQQIARGHALFAQYCSSCHGDAAVSGGINPDLRHSPTLADPEGFGAIVHDGALKENGMIAFSPVMSADDVQTIRHYIIKRAHEDKALAARASGASGGH